MTLKEYITQDRVKQYAIFSREWCLDYLLKPEMYYIRKYQRLLRLEEYYSFVQPSKIKALFFKRKKNIVGSRLGFIIHSGNFDSGLMIYHYGSIIVNPKAKIGRNCTIHGNCCIGSKGGFPDASPILGDNVDIGNNAQILGSIRIADNVKIGAGAVVVKDVLEAGSTVVGVPAHKI